MNTLWQRWRERLTQHSVEGLALYLGKRQQWGFHQEALLAVGAVMAPKLLAQYPGKALKGAQGAFHTHTIDALMSDLFAMERTIEQRDYVNERLVYLHPEPRSLHAYLCTHDGQALTPKTAWEGLHRQALVIAGQLDLMLITEDDQTDSAYYRRRYGSVLEEVWRVYQLIATLLPLTLPDLFSPVPS